MRKTLSAGTLTNRTQSSAGQPRCIGCRRSYDPDTITGYHAAQTWEKWSAGLVCRTCQQRARRGEWTA